MKRHIMNLKSEPFMQMRDGIKTIELRLYDEKRKTVRVGDIIVFKNPDCEPGEISAKVKELHVFKSFKELYDSLDLLKCGYTRENISSARFEDMELYYSQEEQSSFGVVGIEIEPII